MKEDLVLIARIGKAHGLKGELEIQPFVWDEARFEKLGRIFVKAKDGKISEQSIESVRYVHKGILLKIKGFDDRTAAEALRGSEILIPESERPKLPNGRAYYDEVIGLTVVDDESGQSIGHVTNVLDMPASDVFVLDLNGEEHMITNSGDEIRAIDLKKKELRVKLLKPYSAENSEAN
ncbi:MAG: ribosome maturation factor RimM [Candidatus Kapaibacterium sp.]